MYRRFKSQNFLKYFSYLFLLTGISSPCFASDLVEPKVNFQSHLGLFQPLIGNWSIEDYQLDKQGKWQPAGGADWNFYSILDGSAVQDDWIAPSLSKPAPSAGRQYGTNIRILNKDTKEWQMAWMSNTGKKVENFTAKEVDGKIVMRGLYQGSETRITFFDISDSQFSWIMEVAKNNDTNRDKSSSDKKQLNKNASDKNVLGQWKTIYKIKGTKVVM